MHEEATALRHSQIRLGDYLEARQELVRTAYKDSSPGLLAAATGIRAYNALVNHVLFAVFGFGERLHSTPRLERGLGAIRATLAHRGERVSLSIATEKAPWLSPSEPFVIEAGVPVDGVYLSDSTMMQFAVGAIVDISGVRLAALEPAPDT